MAATPANSAVHSKNGIQFGAVVAIESGSASDESKMVRPST
jgi:hypothetical protein